MMMDSFEFILLDYELEFQLRFFSFSFFLSFFSMPALMSTKDALCCLVLWGGGGGGGGEWMCPHLFADMILFVALSVCGF